MRHYQALLAESVRTGYPLQYHNDLLVHDRAFCEQSDPGMPFLWVLRDCGTHVVVPSAAESDTAQAQRSLFEIPGSLARAFGPDCRHYAWDGQALISLVGVHEAEEWLRAEYVVNGGKL